MTLYEKYLFALVIGVLMAMGILNFLMNNKILATISS